jgi:hypothetical protein
MLTSPPITQTRLILPQIDFTIVATVSDLTGQLNHEYSNMINCRIKHVHITAILHQLSQLRYFTYDKLSNLIPYRLFLFLSDSKLTSPANTSVAESKGK